MSSKKNTIRLIGAVAALAGLALAVSCQGFFPPAQIESIAIQPTTATVPVGGTFQMQAFGVDTTGNQLGSVTNKVTWSSSDTSQITVGQNTGVLTGVALVSGASPVTITAGYQALTPQTATASVCVEGGTNPVISPASESFVVTQTFPGFTLQVDANNQTLNVTSAATWTSSDPTDLSITGGTSPTTVTINTAIVQNTPVTVTATYTCLSSSVTQSVVITLEP